MFLTSNILNVTKEGAKLEEVGELKAVGEVAGEAHQWLIGSVKG